MRLERERQGTDRQTETETDRQTDRQTETETDRQTESNINEITHR